MTAVELLNKRLADALGRISGTTPRFQWKRSTDLFWYFRETSLESYQRQCWADRIGVCWLLCEWRVPTGFDVSTGTQYPLTEDNWWRMFRGALPFPARGEYAAYPESQLAPGATPTPELTQNYIRVIDHQISTSYQSHVREIGDDLTTHHRDFRQNQHDQMMEEAPAFGNYAPGTRGGFLSFGGV